MKHLSLFVLCLCAFLLLPAYARADADLVPLLPNARADYRFDYRGDRTPIQVAVDSPGSDALAVSIYTPAALAEAERGGELVAVGRGTPTDAYAAFWLGSFNAQGVYHVVVENPSPGIILYRVSISGPGVSNVSEILPDAPPPAAGYGPAHQLDVPLPPGAGAPALHLTVPGAPAACTHAAQVDVVTYSSLKLCPGEVYPPLHLVGHNLALYGDDEHSAVVTSSGRQFAITVEGDSNLVEGVTIQAHADGADLGAWLCQYDECTFATQPHPTVVNGGLLYGGGLLVRGSRNVIHGVTVRGGTIGIATAGGSGNALIDNRLDDLNGWGSFNLGSVSSYFVGNTLNRENHACRTPDGFKFLHGCETAGWVCLGCTGNVVARNTCQGSGNCFYMSGERNLGSNNNRLVANTCAGATDNCFELTFSRGNILQDNLTGADPVTGAACNYPFWIGGSTVWMQGNRWQCAVNENEALARATASTSVATQLLALGAPAPPAAVSGPAAPSALPSPGRPPLPAGRNRPVPD